MKRGITGFEPDRLAQVIEVRRLSQAQLAAMVGVSPPTLSKWRSGQQTPEFETLVRLASVVNVAPDWFTRPIAPKTSHPLFRSNASAHAGARSMLDARLGWAQELVISLEELVDFPALNLVVRNFISSDQIDDAEIEAAAADCRVLWGLGLGAIPDVVLALENAGVIVVREETGIAKIDGLSAWSSALARPIVHLASDKGNAFRSRFDAAHELGHLVLHRHISTSTAHSQYKEMERQAHRFAGAFLLPAESLLAAIRLPVTIDDLLLLKQREGISVVATIMRLQALDIIDEDEKTLLFKRCYSRWGAKSEPGDDLRTPEQPRLLKRAIELLVSSGVLPVEQVSRRVGLSARDVESLAGLPSGYLDGSAEVISMPSLRRTVGNTVETHSSTHGTVIPFNRRK